MSLQQVSTYVLLLRCSHCSHCITETEDEKCMSPKSVPKSVYLHAITGAVVFSLPFPWEHSAIYQ